MSYSQSYMAKTIIFKEGEPATNLFLVKSGKVLCLKSSKDRLIPVLVATDQDIIGEGAMTSNGVYSYSAVSLSLCEVVSVPAGDFKSVIEQAPNWLVELTSTMIERFQNTANVIAENRVLHKTIMSAEDFTSSLEIELKKILS
jgi:CRP-like cAMP-binding protein